MPAMARVRASSRGGPGSPDAARRRLATVVLLAAVACVSRPPTSVIAAGHEGAPGVTRVLLAPANLVLAMRPELESGAEPIQAEIAGYFEQQGRSVERISLPEARRIWEASVAEVAGNGREPDFAAAAERFARKLGDGRDFHALVIPSLLLQKVVVRHRGAEWDGVERRVRLVNIPRRGGGRSSDVLVDGMATGSLNAVLAVSSLHVMVFNRDGVRVFEGRGGLEFLQEVDLARAHETFRFEIAPRNDLFQDSEAMREAIAVAFDPYLPRLRER